MDANHPPIILIAATFAEMRPVVRQLKLKQSGASFLQTSNTNNPIVGLVTGIGRDRVVNAIQHYDPHEKPTRIINIGFAGALDPSHHSGDLLNITHVMHTDGRSINISPDHPTCDTLLTVDTLIDTTEKKQKLFHQYHAHAIDMESFYLAEFATQNNIPITIIRAITDDAHTALPSDAAQWITPTGQTNTRAIAYSLLKNPKLAITLPALAHAAKIANNAIANKFADFLLNHQPSSYP